MLRIILYAIMSLAIVQSPAVAAENMREGSGLPVPRFVSLKSDDINVRKGPGTRYPIDWVYRREDLPVEIIEEFGQWRKIRDIEGSSGWVHKNMVVGARHAIVLGQKDQHIMLHADADTASPAVVKVEPGVIGKLLECEVEWCRLNISDRKGWALKKKLWGVYDKELYND